MKIPYISAVNSAALIALLSVAPCASASIVDQSQLSANNPLPIDTSNFSVWQSFQAGKNGTLTDIEVFSNGQVEGGSNTLSLNLYSGSGTGGQLLGSLTTSVSSIWDSALNGWLIDINTQSLNTRMVAGQEYTFGIQVLTGNGDGNGDLNIRGLLGSGLNPYANGQAFSASLGSLASWDIEFQTLVTTVPIPTMFWLSAAGFIGITGMARKHRTA